MMNQGADFWTSNRHQPKLGRTVGGRMLRRGEGGWDGLGGPLWSPVPGGRFAAQRADRLGTVGHTSPAGDHKGPPIHPSSSLAPTEHSISFRWVDAYWSCPAVPFLILGD